MNQKQGKQLVNMGLAVVSLAIIILTFGAQTNITVFLLINHSFSHNRLAIQSAFSV